MLAVTHGPSALWYATRGAGAVTLVLLTASVVLGIGEIRRWRPAGAPRFAVAALHRSVSLLALAFLVVHVVTVVLDPFPRISVVAAVVPFAAAYRPLWLGLGTLAADLLVALAVTSLVRRRLGYRAWRGVHWVAYACWPVAILHGLGTGSDVHAAWLAVLTMACIAAVLAALAGRLAADDVAPGARTGVAAATLLGLVALVIWTAQGPLAAGWARRAGTPPAVLAAFAPGSARAVAAAAPPAPAPRRDPLHRPFSSSLAGDVRSGLGAGGVAVVDLQLHLRGGPRGELRIRIGGLPLDGGGVAMQESAVTLGPPSDPGRYQGRIDELNGSRVHALVGSRDGRAMRLTIDLSLAPDSATGVLHSSPVHA
jgi:ferric reductase like protein